MSKKIPIQILAILDAIKMQVSERTGIPAEKIEKLIFEIPNSFLFPKDKIKGRLEYSGENAEFDVPTENNDFGQMIFLKAEKVSSLKKEEIQFVEWAINYETEEIETDIYFIRNGQKQVFTLDSAISPI